MVLSVSFWLHLNFSLHFFKHAHSAVLIFGKEAVNFRTATALLFCDAYFPISYRFLSAHFRQSIGFFTSSTSDGSIKTFQQVGCPLDFLQVASLIEKHITVITINSCV